MMTFVEVARIIEWIWTTRQYNYADTDITASRPADT